MARNSSTTSPARTGRNLPLPSPSSRSTTSSSRPIMPAMRWAIHSASVERASATLPSGRGAQRSSTQGPGLTWGSYEPQVNPGPCVELLWAPRPEGSVAEARSTEAEWIAQRIAGMIGREELVVEREEGEGKGKLRPVRAGDVVLLFRAMSNVHLYESALRKCGLEYYLVGGRAFFAQQEIYDILNLLRALENPQDAVSLAGTLRSPFCCVSDEALFVLSHTRGALWASLQDAGLEEQFPAG